MTAYYIPRAKHTFTRSFDYIDATSVARTVFRVWPTKPYVVIFSFGFIRVLGSPRENNLRTQYNAAAAAVVVVIIIVIVIKRLVFCRLFYRQ